jgi:hypothetical protein
MADLDFSHKVSEIPAAESLPKPYQRTVAAETHGVPELQAATSRYAESTNWMSRIGAEVSARASNAIATQLGTEIGQQPQGDIGIPLTEFDAVMQKSYQTQAESVLGLQASKLVNDANLEMAKIPRLNSSLIESTNKNIALGLQSIFKNAPSEIRPNLEYQYGQLQLHQFSQLNHRMIQEQKEDQKNNTAYASQINSEQAYSFALNGNDKAAISALNATKAANQAASAATVITPAMAKVNIDTARQSYLNGKYAHQYEKARAEGKGEEYLKSIADKKPADISDADYMSVTNNLMNYVSHQQLLRSQDEQLRTAKINVSMAKDIAGITGAQMEDYKQHVSPIQFEQTQLHYINAMKTYNQEQGQLTEGLRNWNDPAQFARLPEKIKNKGFDLLVGKYQEQQQAQGISITPEDAEVQVAASAAGQVPYFTNTLKNKLHSGNPAMMDSAAQQIDELYSMNAGHALIGLNDIDKGIYSQFKSLRDSLPPEEAAKIVIQNANQDPDTQRMNKEKWAAYLKTQTGGYAGYFATSPTDFALKQVGLDKNEFMNPGIANEYGNLILQKYGAFFQNLNGDRQNALELTQQEVKENFGYTGVNGGKFMTLHPIEKVLGYGENSDVVPFIQQDVIKKLSTNFIPLKQKFEQGEANEYWDITNKDFSNKALIYGHKYDPIQVKRYIRSGNKVHSETYNVVLIGNSFNWDVAVQTASGIRPLPQIAPYLGITTYTPNKKEIDDNYLHAQGHK